MSGDRPRLSIVSTLYRSSPYLEEFHRRVCESAAAVNEDFEIVLVDDGSPDDSLQKALALRERDPRVRVVELSRNFGHHRAMMTGLSHARGDLIFLLDCDLEEQPEWLPTFHEAMERKGVDAVYGVQDKRRGSLGTRITGGLFYLLFNRLAKQPIPRNPVVARLMRRDFVQALLGHEERNVFFVGLCAATGFRQLALPVKKQSKGETTYSLAKRLDLFLNGLTSFSAAPLRLLFFSGLGIFLFSLSYFLYLIGKHYLNESTLPGYTSLIASIWIIGGIVLLSIGLVGIYLEKLFTEIKKRPYAIIRKIHE